MSAPSPTCDEEQALLSDAGTQSPALPDLFANETHQHEKATATASGNLARIGEILRRFEPLITLLLALAEVIEPLLVGAFSLASAIWARAAPYHPEEFLPAAYGLVLVFFGGAYMLTLAAVEAFRLFGWEKLGPNLFALYENAVRARDASRYDDTLDEDGDGIADVRQLGSRRALFSRKLKVVLRAVDPEQVSAAISGLTQGFFAVLATLRLRFAEAITLGATIGEIGHRITGRLLRKLGYLITPDEYDKWVPVVVDYMWRCLGIAFSFSIQRGISAFYSSFRGAELFLWGTLTYLVRRKLISSPWVQPGSLAFTILITVIAAAGLYWQFTHFFSLPFPLNIIFFPLTLVEWFLQFAIVFLH